VDFYHPISTDLAIRSVGCNAVASQLERHANDGIGTPSGHGQQAFACLAAPTRSARLISAKSVVTDKMRQLAHGANQGSV